ncbi:hypothetical protein [Pontimicrobium sp. SW4]|uniref:Nuclear transport factor 2 family protein n=1 Tax=Pontimicrobium sp. SW4 TaxID=3153519 RepID=A0AAU7BTH9_9FLAO
MKKVIIMAIVLTTVTLSSTNAQQKNTAKISYPLKEDVSTINGIMKATYEAVSGEAGEIRQWERDHSLHSPNAIYSFPLKKDGKYEYVTMTLNDFHGETDQMVATTAFYENEINREVRIFGNIAHVWSTYETRLKKNGPVERRGINSVQLYYDQNRWWIISWTFDRETEVNKIPKTFEKN